MAPPPLTHSSPPLPSPPPPLTPYPLPPCPLQALEAHATEEGGGTGQGDLGRRGDRAAVRLRQAEEERAGMEDKRARFETALQKANWASEVTKPPINT